MRVKYIIGTLCCIGSSFLPMHLNAQPDNEPSLEFLEFLADMTSDNNKWIDPLHMQELAQNEHPVRTTEGPDNE